MKKEQTPVPNLNKKSIITHAIAAGLIYCGVPKQYAYKIAPIIYSILAWLLTITPIFILAIFLAMFSGGNKPTDKYQSLDPNITQITSEISAEYNVPESLLIGLASYQTSFGTKSPYDNLAHKLNDSMITKSPIGNPDDENEGQGIYLFSKGFIDNNPEINFDPQSFPESTLTIAQLISEQISILSASGIEPPSDYNENDIYWVNVINGLPIADPTSSKWVCTSTSKNIAIKIKDIWGCEFKKSGSRIYYQNPTERDSLTLLSTSQSIPVVVNDALYFTWGYHTDKNNNYKNWEDLSLENCPDGGVFPLSRGDKYKIKDNCDANLNIDMAAKKFILNLKSDKSKSYSRLLAGWGYFFDLVGIDYSQVEITGGFSSAVSESCSNLISTYIENHSPINQSNLTYVQSLTNDPLSPLKSSICSDITLSGAIFESINKIIILNNNENNPNEQIKAISKELFKYQELNFKASPRVGFIPRISDKPIYVDLPFVNDIETSIDSFGFKVLGYSISYGALAPEDPRAGTNPFDSFIFEGGGQISLLSFSRIDPLTLKNAKTSQDPRLVNITCDASNSNFYTLVEYDLRWEKLCSDAKLAGIDLRITSGYRTHQEQIEIAKNNAGMHRAATPGNSPHEKGSALDIWLGSKDGVDSDAKKEFAWLHSIVGCYNPSSLSYRGFTSPITMTQYENNFKEGGTTCASNELPVKRMQTYGLTPLCLNHYSTIEKWSDIPVISCSYETMLSSASGQMREPWHLDLGKSVQFSNTVSNEDCSSILVDGSSQQTIAISVKKIWLCRLTNLGFQNLNVDGEDQYTSNLTDSNLAEEVSSEAVLVSYCTTKFDSQYNKDKRYGLFALSKDPSLKGNYLVDTSNVNIALDKWLANYKLNGYYHGWEDFLLIDSNTFSLNKTSKFPILGRFDSQSPQPNIGDKNNNLIPDWAADPETYFKDGISCDSFYKGDGGK